MKSDVSETEIIHLNMTSLCFQLVLLTIVLLAAFGNDGIRLTFGRADFLGVGISFCLAITLPLILIAYLCGGNLFVLVRCQYKLLCMSKTYKVSKVHSIYYILCCAQYCPTFSLCHFYVSKCGLSLQLYSNTICSALRRTVALNG